MAEKIWELEERAKSARTLGTITRMGGGVFLSIGLGLGFGVVAKAASSEDSYEISAEIFTVADAAVIAAGFILRDVGKDLGQQARVMEAEILRRETVEPVPPLPEPGI